MVKRILDFLSFLPKEVYVFLISMLPIIELRGAVPVGAAIGLPFYVNYILAVLGNILPVPFILLFIPKILDLMEKVKIFRPIVKWVREKADKYKGKIIRNSEFEIRNVSSNETVDNCFLRSECAETRSNASEACPHEQNDYVSRDEDIEEPEEIRNSELEIRNEEFEDERSPHPSAEPTPSPRGRQKATLKGGAFIALMMFVAIPLPGTGAWTGSLVAALFNLPKRSSLLAISLGVMICGVIMCLASYGVLGFLKFLL